MFNDDSNKIKIALIFLGISLILFITNKVLSSDGNNEKQLNNLMKSIGGTYYEQIIYETFKEDENTFNSLKKYESKGYLVDVQTAMDNIKYKTDKFINTKTGEKCDLVSSYIRIYPKSPYGLKDYKIETELSCGY